MNALPQIRSWLTGRGRTLGAAALVLAALSAGRVITDRLPAPGDIAARPFERVAAIGDAAHLRVGDVKVTEVTGAKEWNGILYAKRTTGLWVGATIELMPSRRESGISAASVRDNEGHVWTLGRGESTCKGIVAGIRIVCKVVVEVPARPIPGAELVLRWNDFDDRYDDQAVVPFTLGPDEVATWSTNPPLKLPLAKAGNT